MVAVLFDAPEAVSPKLHNQLFALFTLAKCTESPGAICEDGVYVKAVLVGGVKTCILFVNVTAVVQPAESMVTLAV